MRGIKYWLNGKLTKDERMGYFLAIGIPRSDVEWLETCNIQPLGYDYETVQSLAQMGVPVEHVPTYIHAALKISQESTLSVEQAVYHMARMVALTGLDHGLVPSLRHQILSIADDATRGEA